jgi:hypothetical protein
MVTKGSVTKVCKQCFRLIKPVVNGEIVLRLPNELPRAVLCVFEWMGSGHCDGGSRNDNVLLFESVAPALVPR